MRNDPTASDASLLAAAVAGDQQAFTTLMRRHEDRIFSVALRMTGDRADALDATQDAFIAVYRQGASFRGDSAFSTWLYRIAVNACKDLLRKKARQPQPEADDQLAAVPAPGGPVDARVLERLDIGEALAALQEDYRVAVAMHDLGGFAYEEIAQVTGVAIGTVKSRISRGRRRLAELLEHPRPPVASKEEP